jgi:hypothetical protein
MANSQSIALLCTISRGGFTDERVFRIQVADGSTYVGACARQYCFTRGRVPLKREQPERGKTIDGLVFATRVREEQDGVALVSVPDGAVLPVKVDQIKELPKEFSPDVPV